MGLYLRARREFPLTLTKNGQSMEPRKLNRRAGIYRQRGDEIKRLIQNLMSDRRNVPEQHFCRSGE